MKILNKTDRLLGSILSGVMQNIFAVKAFGQDLHAQHCGQC